jgi:uncharacterized membrane protein YidH (DUF202 family)
VIRNRKFHAHNCCLVTASEGDLSRTRLAAERTWLAWWRSGIAASAVAVGVGGVVPRLIEGSRTAYIVLGVGYAVLSAGVFARGRVAPAQR